MASQVSCKKTLTFAEAGLYKVLLTCFREVKYGRQWTEGQELLAQLYAVQATHQAMDQQIGSAGCHMHPGMLKQMLQTEV